METRNNQTVAFTGHRKERILQGFGNDPRILAQIREAVAGMVTELYGQGYKEYYTGMASGFDMTAAEAVLQVRERYEGIKLIAAVPFRKQPLWFEAEDRLLYARLLERMDRVVMVSENYHKGCYLRRDEYMVRKAGCYRCLLGPRTERGNILHGKQGVGMRQAGHQHPRKAEIVGTGL